MTAHPPEEYDMRTNEGLGWQLPSPGYDTPETSFEADGG